MSFTPYTNSPSVSTFLKDTGNHTHLGELGQLSTVSSDPWINITTTTSTGPSVQFFPHPDMQSVFKENPPMNITIKVVEIIEGFVGQLIHQGKIVWQSLPKKTYEAAKRKAERHHVQVIAELFGDQG